MKSSLESSNFISFIACVRCGTVLVFIIVRNRMSRQLLLFKYLHPKPSKKHHTADDDTDLFIRDSMHSDVKMHLNKMLK